MAAIGVFSLLVAFVTAVLSVVTLTAGHFIKADVHETVSWAGRLSAILTFVALTVCCGVLLFCFMTDDYTIKYVLYEHVSTSGALGTLYRISGLWAGREGSLLFWAWLISLFGAIVSFRRMRDPEELDNMAVLMLQLVLVAFVGVLLFSEDNMPFTLTDSSYFDENGSLTKVAQMYGMNSLLQHWAMAIHPPTLFVGYAGLTVPFAYAIAAIIVNDPSTEWVHRCERFVLVSWAFLTIGIGLGAVWAYVVLGWGGYWGWDPVENASLLSWLVTVALVHSFAVYKNRDMFKRWAVMCACLAFCFCIVGTFISRSGLVQSVHAFSGDTVSLVLFGSLIVVSFLLGVIGCVVRRKSFGTTKGKGADFSSMISKDGAYFINNLVMIVLAALLAYLTIAQALPSWMPFGGESVSADTYNAIAHPVGILYLLMLAVCPLLSWGKTNMRDFVRRAKVPGICAVVMFIVLMVYFVTVLIPLYDTIVSTGATNAEAVTSQGPAPYYFFLTVMGLLTASLLFFNSLFQLGRALRSRARVLRKLPGIGSAISHAALGILLVGLIGSSMYTYEKTAFIHYDETSGDCTENYYIRDYELNFTGGDIRVGENGMDVLYVTQYDVYKGDKYLTYVEPNIQLVMTTQQQKLNAAVLSLPLEDLFVVYQGVSDDANLSLDVRINPLISFVWIGMVLLVLGMFVSLFGARRPRSKEEAAAEEAAALSDGEAQAELAATKAELESLREELAATNARLAEQNDL